MIQRLQIQNYAIIDAISIDFSGRMNVITGETGAGKSILMGALSLILGDRADTTVLLNREKKCYVEGVFELGGKTAAAAFFSVPMPLMTSAGITSSPMSKWISDRADCAP